MTIVLKIISFYKIKMELITQVDKKDNVIGARPKSDFDDPNLIHRSAHILIFNSKGEVLIQKRSSKKKKYPGQYDYSVSGTVRYGETYEQTLQREIKEELGIDIKFKKLFKFSHFDDIDSAIKVLYIGNYDGDFILQKEEIESIKWVSLEELKEDINNNSRDYCEPFIVSLKKYFKEYS